MYAHLCFNCRCVPVVALNIGLVENISVRLYRYALVFCTILIIIVLYCPQILQCGVLGMRSVASVSMQRYMRYV